MWYDDVAAGLFRHKHEASRTCRQVCSTITTRHHIHVRRSVPTQARSITYMCAGLIQLKHTPSRICPQICSESRHKHVPSRTCLQVCSNTSTRHNEHVRRSVPTQARGITNMSAGLLQHKHEVSRTCLQVSFDTSTRHHIHVCRSVPTKARPIFYSFMAPNLLMLTATCPKKKNIF